MTGGIRRAANRNGLLLVLVGLAQGVLSLLAQAAFTTAFGGSLGVLVSGMIVLPLSVVVVAILADAFVQLTDSGAPSY